MCSSTLGTGIAPALLPTTAGISEPAGFVGPVTATGLPSVVLSEPWVPSSGYSGSVVSKISSAEVADETRTQSLPLIQSTNMGVVVPPLATGTKSTFSTLVIPSSSSVEPTSGSSDGTSIPVSSSTKGAVAGGVVGGIAGVALLAGLATFLVSRRRMRLRKETEEKQMKDSFVIATQYEIPPTNGEESRSTIEEH